MKNKGRLFKIILLILSFLLICMLAYMSFFMNRFVLREQTNNLDSSNLRLLQQADEGVLRMVDDLEHQVRLLLSGAELTQVLINPQNENVDDNVHILKSLKNCAAINPYVSAVWLYSPTSQVIFSSDGYRVERQDSAIDGLLTAMIDTPGQRAAADLLETLYIYEENLYVVVDFVPASRLGRFIFQVDAEQLNALLHVDESDWGQLMIADRSGVYLFNSGPAGEASLDLSDTNNFYADSALRRTEESYYRLDDTRLGWTFLMSIQSSAGLFDSAGFWVLTIPFLIFLTVLGLGGAYLITRQLYTPINRLMELVLSKNQPALDGAAQDEVDYLEGAYQQTLSANQEYRAQLTRIGRGMKEQLYRSLLSGRLETNVDAEGLLLAEDQAAGGWYRVLLVRVGDSDLALQDPLKRRLPLSALERLADAAPECLCCLSQENDTLAVILRFRRELSPAQQEQARAKLEASWKQRLDSAECHLLYGWGQPYSSLFQLRESGLEAARDLQYRLYVDADTEATDSAATSEASALERRLRQLIDQAVGERGQVERYADLIQAELSQAGDEDAYQLAENLLLEKLLLYQESSGEPTPPQPEPPQEGFLAFCRDALERCQVSAGKKKFRYIEEGKKYIEEHYMDCDLSANEISDHIGISASYFSSLFNELVQESVTSYLNQIRVQHAKSLLTITRIAIKEVGFKCGFNSANVFGRVFKKYTNMSPKQFRDEAQDKLGAS